MDNIRLTNPPYDDVFCTLLNDCSPLIIPVINEIFGENYSGKEKIVFSTDEHFLNQQDGIENISSLMKTGLKNMRKKK